MHPAPIRFAILHDDAAFDPWQTLCLERLGALPEVRAELLITLQLPGLIQPRELAGAPQLLLPQAIDSGGAAASAALARIKDGDLDFILSFVDARAPAAIVDIPRYGVWRFQFGALTQKRYGPVGFWEVYAGEPVSTAALIRVQHKSDAVVILRDAYFRTDLLSYARNKQAMLARVSLWPAQLCADIRNDVRERLSAEAVPGAARRHAPPSARERLMCRARIGARAVAVALRSLFCHDQWNVGIVAQPIAAFLRAERRAAVQWLPAPRRNELRADPFGVLRDGRLTILCEHFSYRDNRGFIVAIEPMNPASATRVAIGPQPAVHMSYPFLLEAGAQTLCVPETSDAGEIALYEIERFPDRWTKVATLIAGMAVVDATLFQHGDRWWLAGSEVAPKGANCELHLWHAPKPIGPWSAHPGNPVKVDIRSARPAGTPFVVDGVLYRPAQDCSITYGARVMINRVVTLTAVAFREEACVAVDPDPTGPYPSGLHTLSQIGNATLIDGKRVHFAPAEFRRVFLKTLSSALGRWRLTSG